MYHEAGRQVGPKPNTLSGALKAVKTPTQSKGKACPDSEGKISRLANFQRSCKAQSYRRRRQRFLYRADKEETGSATKLLKPASGDCSERNLN